MRDHASSLTTSRGDLSVRMPGSRGCRSFPCTVHSMKPACTISSGRTQCARRRGSPFAFVKGGAGSSIASSRVRRSRSSFVSKPVPILSREDETVAVVVADEPRAETRARALRIGEAADHDLLRELALHLQPHTWIAGARTESLSAWRSPLPILRGVRDPTVQDRR
jgi:hypothetical protein